MQAKRKFTQEFKQQAVEHYERSEQSVKEVSKTLGIGMSTLNRWISNARKNEGKVEHRGSGNYSSEEAKEMSKLRKELKDTKDALLILKKAISILNE